jgi:hypothetical protein
VKGQVDLAIRHLQWLEVFPTLTDAESLDIKIFFDLWRSGKLLPYQDYALVVQNARPVLFVRMAKGADHHVIMNICSHFTGDAFFARCKTTRFHSDPVSKGQNKLDPAVFNQVCRILGAVEEEDGPDRRRKSENVAYIGILPLKCSSRGISGL